MVTTFSCDENNDIFIGPDGNLSLSTSLQAVLFICQNKARTRLNEMIFEPDSGLPYMESVFSEPKNFFRFKRELRKALENTDGVEKVLDIIVEENQTVFFYSATIATIYGSGVVDGTTTI
jgi:hypothetical protein